MKSIKRQFPLICDAKEEWENEDKKLHRLDGPAGVYNNQDYEWFYNGKHHRTDGPAMKLFSGLMYQWYVGGISMEFGEKASNIASLSTEQFLKYMREIKKFNKRVLSK